MKKHYLLLATAAMIMAGCANDDFIGEDSTAQDGKQTIEFNMSTPAMTRAYDSSTQHGKLDNKFIVWGEKNEVDASNSFYEATDLTTVFKNYVVSWGENTANTTNSNTKDWEYVGVDHSKYDTNVVSTIGSTKAQTIKYWDMNANDYTFTAVSAPDTEVEAGTIKITKILKSSSSPASVYDKGYTVELKSGATTGNIYFADRVNIAKGTTTTTNEQDKYGGYVKFTFRNFQTKIRFGFYETVPGYTVTIKDVTYGSTSKGTSNFGVNSSFYDMPTGDNTIKYNVTYETGAQGTGTTANRVKINADSSAKAATSKEFGTGIFGDTLKITSSDPTYDVAAYTPILPNPDNASDMSFKVSYTLTSQDTGEKIEVTDKEVVVPNEYCKWKSNYAYTYLFKISDQSADLYPITFDACVVEDETGKQETITEVGGDTKSTSITTFAYDTQNKKIVESSDNEYPAGSEIYATVMEGSDNKTLVLDSSNGTVNVKLYTVTTTDAAKYPVTEKSVAKALDTTNYPLATGVTANIVATEASGASVETSVPAEDGVGTRSISALKWTDNTTSTGTVYYAIQYKNTANELCYKVVKVVKK